MVFKLIRQAFCKHEYELQHRVIKSAPFEIPYWEYHRCVWVCKKCGKVVEIGL